MASINKVILIGNLCKEPDIKYLPDGGSVANLSLATNSKYKNKNGEMVEEVEFHRLTAYGKLSEIIGQYAHKGKSIYVEGKLKTRKWTDKQGVEKYTTEIVIDQMQLLGGREQASTEQVGTRDNPAPAKQASQAPKRAADLDDDIPF